MASTRTAAYSMERIGGARVRGPRSAADVAGGLRQSAQFARDMVEYWARVGPDLEATPNQLAGEVASAKADVRNDERGGAVEPVMSSGHTITITPGDAHVEVRLDGELLASSDHPVLLHETGLPTRYYLPRHDVRMDLLRPTTFHTTCPFKGEASYWSADIDGRTHDGIVWAYETPIAAATQITGLLSFYPDRAEVTVDGEVVKA